MIFVDYANEVEITGLVTGGFIQSIDISSFMIDSSALAVCIRVIRDNPIGTRLWQIRDVNDNINSWVRSSANIYCETIVGLNGGTTIKYAITLDMPCRFFITGEIHAPAIIHPTALWKNLVEPVGGWDDWIDMQPTPINGDVLSDIDAVIIKTIARDDNIFGIREKGSVEATMKSSFVGGQQWWVIGLDENGYFQIKTTGKSGEDIHDMFFIEIGYIKKGSGVVTLLNPTITHDLFETIVQVSDWTEVDLSDFFPEDTITIGINWENFHAGNSRVAFFRAIGASGMIRRIIYTLNTVTQMVTLDADRKCEYDMRSDSIFAVPRWYEGPPPDAIGSVKFDSQIKKVVSMDSQILRVV